MSIDKLPNNVVLWAGQPGAYEDLERQDKWLASASAEDLAGLGPKVYAGSDDSEFGEYGYMVSSHENTAIIEIRGKLVPGDAWYNKYVGRTGYTEIQAAFAAAAKAPGIDNVVMAINSQGGSTSGVGEAANFISSFDKNVMPVRAHTSGDMLSAAMWLGSAARKRMATEMSSVGSIGVIAIHKEYTEMFKKEGIGVTVFREGDNKALVNPYEKLTKEARSYIEAQMSQLNDFFVQALSTNLGLTEAYVRDKIADGSEFFGAEAKSLGLVDKVGTLDNLLSSLLNRQDSGTATNRSYTGATAMSLKSEESVLSPEAQAAASAGAPLEVAIENHPAPAGTEEVAPVVAEATPVEASSTNDVVVPTEAATLMVGVSTGLDSLVTKLSNTLEEAANLKAEVCGLKAELSAAKEGDSALRRLATSWCQRMQVPLGLARLAPEGMSSGALATEVSRVRDIFDAKYRPGQKVEASHEADDAAKPGVVTSITQSRQSAASFKR